MIKTELFFELKSIKDKIERNGLRPETKILGNGSALESIEFVNLILELEENLEEKYESSIDLYDLVLNSGMEELNFSDLLNIINKSFVTQKCT
jgi:hypothetical protein